MRASALRSRDRKAIARQLQSVADRRKNHQRYLKSETVDPHKSMVVLGKIADFMPKEMAKLLCCVGRPHLLLVTSSR